MKKVISIALTLLMVAVMLPVMAMAEEGTTLPEAKNGVITLDKNVTLSKYAKITDTTLDLNGHTISIAAGLALDVYGTVTIKDSSANGTGAIVSEAVASKPGTSIGVWVNEETTLIVESGTIKGANFGIAVLGANAKLTMSGGTVYGISGNGNQVDNGTTITISGGKVFPGTNSDIAIYHPQNGTLNITGGTISGPTAIYMKSGVANITGATISGTGSKVDPVANGNGADSTGDAIVMDSKTGYYGNMILNLGAGNTITSTNGYALQVANTDVRNSTNVTALNITGGNFTGSPDAVKLSDEFKAAVADANINASASITGGTFNGNTDELKPYIPSNMEITASGNVVNRPIIIYTPDNEPAFLSGANQVVAPGAAATFRIDEEYDRLLAVAVDGVTLDKSNYEAWSGSTYIKLLPKFMKTLSVGTHTLTAYFTSHTVSTTFTISEGAKNPATGANDLVGVAAAMAVVSLLGAAAVIRKK